jgi:adenylate kinase family enzyme
MMSTTESITTVSAETLRACFCQPDGPRLLGLCGVSGSGKSTLAALLEHKHDWHQIAMADPIVNMLHSLLADAGVPACWITERVLKEQPSSIGYSYRQLAQTLGTDWGRNMLDPSLWMRVAQHRIAQAAAHERNVVISDIRFPDEAAWLARMGGRLVRVQRPTATGVRAHESEQHAESLPAQFVVHNRGSLQDLDSAASELAREMALSPGAD